MPKHKLTDRWIQAAPPPVQGRREVGDVLCPGLHLRITSTGVKSWSVVMRVRDRVQRVTLGRYPVVTLSAARKEAMRLLREVSEGGDPAADAKAALVAAAAERGFNLGAVIDAYAEHIRKNARSWELIASSLRRAEMMPLHGCVATNVTKRELMAVVDALATDKPQAAVNLLKHLKMMLNHAVSRDMLAANPLDKVRAPAKGGERDRVLTDAELAAVWRGCAELPQPWSSMIRVMMLTGQRRCEVSNMRWEEIDGDTWLIPRERVKKDRSHAVPLTPAVMRALAPLCRREAKGYVFSTDGGKTAASNFAKVKRKLDEASVTSGWVLHDLRRTLRSGMAALGVGRDVARAIVNHADGKIDRVYNRYEYAAEKREALEQWERYLFGLAGT